MKSLILLILTICGSCASYAETVDGPANIRSEPNGAVVASIDDGVKLDTDGVQNGWLKVQIPVNVDKSAVSRDFSWIAAHTKLFDAEGNMIGITVSATKFIWDGDTRSKRLQGVIVGVTAKSNIRPETLLEPEIEKRLKGHQLSLERDWSQYMVKSGYEPWKSSGDFDAFQANDQQVLDPSPGPRVILFFYRKNLFAIYHVRPIVYSNFVATLPAHDGRLDFLTHLKGKANKDFKREFVTPLNEAD